MESVEPVENIPEIEALRIHPQLRENYDIHRTIGRGAQGTVYEARDLRTGEIVAIKALSFREMSDWKASELFMREIALLKSMQIEGTPRYIDAIDATASPQSYYFLVQEFIPGESLQAKLDRGERFCTQAVIAIALAIIPILEKLRSYSPPIVHRDIKPSNIMMTPDGDIYLIDFGAAMFSERRTGGSTFAGTAGYMAPEQCMGSSTPDSDVYGLGATLIHLLTGIAPYKMQKQENAAIVPKRKNGRFLTALRKPFTALAGGFRKRWPRDRKRHAAAFPCSMTLPFKPYLPVDTPQWFVELLELMVSPYPNQRVKDLDRLVHAIRTIGGVELDGHSVHSDAAAHLANLRIIEYHPVFPFSIHITLYLLGIFFYLIDRHLLSADHLIKAFVPKDVQTVVLILGAHIFFILINLAVGPFKGAEEAQHRKAMEQFGKDPSFYITDDPYGRKRPKDWWERDD
ncbi:MAG: serine/threonine protein kinase [Proteobacteria bacterium]|nr:serine/threonine protein kinase [Pseudomonadota bacterium]MCL2326777.1 serine/threonine protein kinase [Pseudomonadota bacterium]